MTCILSVDTDVFVLFLYWVNRADMQCKVQMERWDGSVLFMLTLSHCDTTSYPYCKRKCHCTEYNMISGNYVGVTTLGDIGSTHTELMNAAMHFFVALYRQPPGTSMESAR